MAVSRDDAFPEIDVCKCFGIL